jgi:MFS family permease
MRKLTRAFYRYLGLHSLLIGIFPFFIPVFLWKNGFELGEISLFIGAAGVGFCCALWVWDRLRHMVSLTTLIGLSLALELLLLLNVQILGMSLDVLLLLGISYGAYNSFFWTTQRALFFERVDGTNSGRRYGNLQIYVGFLLQVGILVGGVLLEKTGFRYILVSSAVLCALGFLMFVISKPVFPESVNNIQPIKIRDIVTFRDTDSSRLIFIIDGIYLFLESFFWVISLFLLAHESFARLGLIILFLAVVFGIIFYLLKNTIDRLGRRRIYRFSVALYALSWVLRALVDHEASLLLTYIALVLITFCTSFFRLAMNKRFYDLARDTLSHRYLVLKSYYTQITLALVFLGFGLITQHSVDSEKFLGPIYWLAAAGAFIYLFYGADRYKEKG